MKPILKLDVGGCFAFSPDGERITVAKKSPGNKMAPNVRVRDGQEAAMVDRLPENTRAIAWSPSGKVLAYGAMYERVTLCDPSTGSVLHKVPINDRSEIYNMAFVPGTDILIHATRGKMLTVIDAFTGTVTNEIGGDSSVAAFDADARLHSPYLGGRTALARSFAVERPGLKWNTVDINPAGNLVALLWRELLELRSWPGNVVLGQWKLAGVGSLIPLIGFDPTGRHLAAALSRSTFVYEVADLLPEGHGA